MMDVLPWVGWVGFRGPFIGITSRSTFQIRSVFDKHLCYLCYQFYKVFSPHNKKEKKEKKKQKQKTKRLNPWIDLVNLKVLFLRNSKELDFLCDCSNGVCLPNVLKNMFIMLFP